MKISKTEESSLLIALTEVLQKSRITSYGYVAIGVGTEKDFKNNLEPDLAKRLYEHLDDGGLESFLQKYVMKKIFENGQSPPEKDKKNPTNDISIKNYSEFSDVLKSSRKIVSYIKDLPFQYQVISPAFKYLGSYKFKDVEIEFGDRMKIVSGSNIVEDFITRNSNNLIDELYVSYEARGHDIRSIDTEGLYFVYRTSGLITNRTKPKPLYDFFDDIRAFYGACMAYDFIAGSFFFGDEARIPVMANVMSNERSFAFLDFLDTDLQKATHAWTKPEMRSRLDQGESLEDILVNVKKLFSCRENQRLKTAAIWLFRAHTSEKGMDRILDATIAMEVMLGDRETSDRIGLSKLMANRCAYSLGRSSNDRREIEELFVKFYKFRSEIVHSGRLRISKEENELVNRGINLSARVLIHELELSD